MRRIFLAPFNSFLQKRHEDPVLFLARVEECTYMAIFCEGAPGQTDRCIGCIVHVIPLLQYSGLAWVLAEYELAAWIRPTGARDR